MLPVYRYGSKDQLVADVEEAIIRPVEEWELGFNRTKALRDENAALQARIRQLETQVEGEV